MARKRLFSRVKNILFNLKFIFAAHVILGIGLVSFLVFNYFFGIGILTNAHLKYMRWTMRNVVKVTNLGQSTGGTGWVTSSTKSGTTVIITNGHVCGVADEDGYVTVMYRGRATIERIIKVYPDHDLCAITAPARATGGFRIAKSVEYGEMVYTMGHPYLEPDTVTGGELSGPMRIPVVIKRIQDPRECEGLDLEVELESPFSSDLLCLRWHQAQASSVSIQPGNSGSPTVNNYGNVVAVAFAANEAGTRSYHVPLADLNKFLGEL